MNWPEEIRRFIEAKVRDRGQETIERITREIENTEGVPKGFTLMLVREDRRH